MLESLVKDKHSSLLRKSVNYGRKKFYNNGPSTFVIDRQSISLSQTFLSHVSKFGGHGDNVIKSFLGRQIS
jgi:hypothetical protein